jgi:colicin import membrane protein
MNPRYSHAYLVSCMLHGAVVAAILLLAYLANQAVTDKPKIFELVAGGGDNYAATEAPAIGVPGGIKAVLPAPTVAETPAQIGFLSFWDSV